MKNKIISFRLFSLSIRLAIIVYGIFSIFQISSCKKYLDKPTSKSLVIPKTIDDLQALLNNYIGLNGNANSFGELASDNLYVTTSTFQKFLSSAPITPIEPNLSWSEPLIYIWDTDPHSRAADNPYPWRYPYQDPIGVSNVVLDIIKTIPQDANNSDEWNNVKGSALFFRAFAFYDLAQVYCRPYSATANTDLGIVLKVTSNINEKIVRATVQQTYDKIITDLKEAAELLPEKVIMVNRPTKAAAYGALARTYLSMRDYTNAGRYADLCLQKYNTLVDYNTLIPVGIPPIPIFNPEIIFFNCQDRFGNLYSANGSIIDSLLFRSFEGNDLRKSIFCRYDTGVYKFQGTYASNEGDFSGVTSATAKQWSLLFNGIATDEMYLIRAECNARAGNVTDAMKDLNALMIKRWKTGSFTPFTATNAADALSKILSERRKELCFRGLRWSDLRRFNLEGANITLTRIINGITYTLPPNDKRWVMLIPWDVINLGGIEQNPR